MPRFATRMRPISAQHPITEFYREEFLKHRRCLEQQRAYYSEGAITDVETALAKIISQLEHLSTQAQRPAIGQLAPETIRRRHRSLGLVRSQALALTRSLDTLRQDLIAIVRAGIAAVDAGRLVEQAASAPNAVPVGPLRVIAAGKAAVPMARAAHDLFGPRIRAGLVIGPPGAGGADVPFELVVGGHPMPTAESERAGAARSRWRPRCSRTNRCWCCCRAARPR